MHRKSEYINTVMTGLTSLPYLPVTVHVVCFGLYKSLQCPRGEAERTFLRFEGATSGQSGSWELRWASLDSCRTWKSQRSEKIAQQSRWFRQSYRTKPTKQKETKVIRSHPSFSCLVWLTDQGILSLDRVWESQDGLHRTEISQQQNCAVLSGSWRPGWLPKTFFLDFIYTFEILWCLNNHYPPSAPRWASCGCWLRAEGSGITPVRLWEGQGLSAPTRWKMMWAESLLSASQVDVHLQHEYTHGWNIPRATATGK